MKTPAQVRLEIANENLYPSWDELRLHNYKNYEAMNDFEDIAMETYANIRNTKLLDDEVLEAMGFTEEYHYWHLGEFKLTKEDDGLAFSHNGKLIKYTHELYELGVKPKED